MLVEILDRKCRVIGAVKEEIVHKNNLFHKRVLGLFYNKEKNLCLCKFKTTKGEALWDFPVNIHVPAMVSKEDAIAFYLKGSISYSSIKILLNNLLFKKKNEFITMAVLRDFCVDLVWKEIKIEDVIFLHRDEFFFLFKKYPSLFSDYVAFCVDMGLVYFGVN